VFESYFEPPDQEEPDYTEQAGQWLAAYGEQDWEGFDAALQGVLLPNGILRTIRFLHGAADIMDGLLQELEEEAARANRYEAFLVAQPLKRTLANLSKKYGSYALPALVQAVLDDSDGQGQEDEQAEESGG